MLMMVLRKSKKRDNMGALFLILSVVLFLLAGFGASIGSEGPGDLVAFGLASFALGYLFNGSFADLRSRF
jgi:hypothetical protein